MLFNFSSEAAYVFGHPVFGTHFCFFLAQETSRDITANRQSPSMTVLRCVNY